MIGFSSIRQSYQLKLYLENTLLHGEWRCEAEPMYSYEVYEAEHVISLDPGTVISAATETGARCLRAGGELKDDEAVAENQR